MRYFGIKKNIIWLVFFILLIWLCFGLSDVYAEGEDYPGSQDEHVIRTITYYVNGEKIDSVTVENGDSVTIGTENWPSEYEDYRLICWSTEPNGGEYFDNGEVISMVEQDYALFAQMARVYKIGISDGIANGRIYCDKDAFPDYDVHVYGIPNEGYVLNYISVRTESGESVTASPFITSYSGEENNNEWTFMMPHEDVTIDASFKKPVEPKFTVEFTVENKDYEKQTVVRGGKATRPADPVKEGYIFDGWYYYEELTMPEDMNTLYDFDTEVTNHLTLIGKWKKEEHNLRMVDRREPSCTTDGNIIYWICDKCGKLFGDEEGNTVINEQDTVIPAAGHLFGEWKTVKEATCIEAGSKEKVCSVCSDKVTESIPALGHDWSDPEWTWANDHSSASAKFTCKNDGTHVETVNATVTSAVDASGDNTVYTVKATFNGKEYKDTVTEEIKPQASDERLYGKARYDTAIEAADKYKEATGSKFQNVIVAYGRNFPDALAGGYLAKVKNAPILLVEPSEENRVAEYIKKNIASGGKVYLLGGTGVVSSAFEKKVENRGIKTERLGGQTRFDTNLAILKEAGVKDEDILVCTGYGYADSLSASAVGKPILLVDKNFSEAQKEYIKGLNTKQFYLIGGEGVVSNKIQTDLKKLNNSYSVERLWGQSRYETSTAVAKKFFPKAKTVILAYAQNFPDGLSGGPLAMKKNAPIVLTDTKTTAAAKSYIKSAGAVQSITLGGPALISDIAVKAIMGR